MNGRGLFFLAESWRTESICLVMTKRVRNNQANELRSLKASHSSGFKWFDCIYINDQ